MKPAKIALISLIALMVLLYLGGNVSGFSLREGATACTCGKAKDGTCKMCKKFK